MMFVFNELREEVRNTPKAQQYKGLHRVFWFLAAVLLIIAIAFGIAYVTRGSKIKDFTGVGEAKILSMTVERRNNRAEPRTETKYVFDVLVTAGYDAFITKQKLASSHGWNRGDVVPIVYNVKNPQEFVMGTTPEEYSDWIGKCNIAGIACFIGALIMYFTGCLVKQRAREKSGIWTLN